VRALFNTNVLYGPKNDVGKGSYSTFGSGFAAHFSFVDIELPIAGYVLQPSQLSFSALVCTRYDDERIRLSSISTRSRVGGVLELRWATQQHQCLDQHKAKDRRDGKSLPTASAFFSPLNMVVCFALLVLDGSCVFFF
jgi:hypothetical protein